LNNYYWNYF